MPLKFTSKEKRDELAERLATLSLHMMRAWDQGHDGSITTTPEMWEDVQTAACVVGLSEIQEDNVDALMAEQEAGFARQQKAKGV